MAYLKLSNDQKLCYSCIGDGEPLFLLNGIMMNQQFWALQNKFFSASGLQVITHDFYGQGQNIMPRDEISFIDHTENIIALMDYLQIEKAHLLGISYGAEVGLIFALYHPERVKTLTAACAVSEVRPLLKAIAQSWISVCQKYDAALLFDVMVPYVYGEKFLSKHQLWLKERKNHFIKAVYKEWFDGFLQLLDSFLKLDISEQLPQLKAKTLIISAENDILKPPSYGQLLAEKIPGAIFKIMEEVGHAPFLENTACFNGLVEEFIKSA